MARIEGRLQGQQHLPPWRATLDTVHGLAHIAAPDAVDESLDALKQVSQ